MRHTTLIAGLLTILATPTFANDRVDQRALDERDAIECLRAGTINAREARMLAGATTAFAESRTSLKRVAESCRLALRAIAYDRDEKIAQDFEQ